MKAYVLHINMPAHKGIAVEDTYIKGAPGLYMEYAELSASGKWQPWVTLDIYEAQVWAAKPHYVHYVVEEIEI